MTSNVGDMLTLAFNGLPPLASLTYVWKWWDNTVDVTTSGTVAKALTKGGNPSDNFQVRFSATAVDDIGQSSQFSSALVVNNPPTVLPGSANLSRNDGTFPFTTTGTLIAYDLESRPLQFAWYAGGNFVGSGINSFNFGHVTGTYSGTQVGECMVSSSHIDYAVTANGSLSCYIWDDQGGTTVVKFPVFGRTPQTVALSSNSSDNSVLVDAAGTPSLRIGSAVQAQFVVYTPTQTHPLAFKWAYYGSNGWSQTLYSNGTTTPFSDGSFQNVDLKSIANETVGPKIAECFVRDQVTGQLTTVKLGISLTANNPPNIASVAVTPTAPHVNGFVTFAANATDPDTDLVHYKWQFTSLPLTTRYGRTVSVSTAGIASGNRVTAVLTVTDLLGATATMNVQSPALLP